MKLIMKKARKNRNLVSFRDFGYMIALVNTTDDQNSVTHYSW